jgi:hypothetical protein
MAPPGPAQAQNLEAGKSPSQIFAGTCSACHKTPRGLLRTIPPGSLPGFLREHYTTSSNMASLLSGYLISNGAADTRYGSGQGRPGMSARPEQAGRYGRRTNSPREAAEPPPGGGPDADRLSEQAGPRHRGRSARRTPPAGEQPEAAKPPEGVPAQQADQRGHEGRKARHRPARRGRPTTEEEPGMGAAAPEKGSPEGARSDDVKSGTGTAPKADPAGDQSAKGEAAKEEKPANATNEARPASEGVSTSAKSDESPKETGSTAPVSPVTPAAAAAPPVAAPATAAPSATAVPPASK